MAGTVFLRSWKSHGRHSSAKTPSRASPLHGLPYGDSLPSLPKEFRETLLRSNASGGLPPEALERRVADAVSSHEMLLRPVIIAFQGGMSSLPISLPIVRDLVRFVLLLKIPQPSFDAGGRPPQSPRQLPRRRGLAEQKVIIFRREGSAIRHHRPPTGQL